MKKTFNALKLSGIFLLMVISFIACDKDFSVIDSDVLGKENSNFTTIHDTLPVTAYNKKLDSLQINGLASNLLGVYIDPAYGKTTASIVAQLTPTTFQLTTSTTKFFGENPAIDSVILKIPYFNRVTGTDDDGNTTYTIQDSLYGEGSDGSVNPFKLSVYKNNYFLRDFDPSSGLGATQSYYSRADETVNNTDNFALNGSSVINFDSNKGDLLLDTVITPSAKSEELWEISSTDTVKTRIVPQLRMQLDTLFWSNTIIKKEGDPVLSNSNNFNDYFRGLYFKAEAQNENGSMVLLNLASSEANITIYYSKDSTVEGERTQSTYTLNFSGNILNTFINDFNVTLQNGDETLGDEKLYLKGTEGSMAIVDLFPGSVECENEDGSISTIPALDCFLKTYRKTDTNDNFIKENGTGDYILKQLINDAQLIIYEDEVMQTYPKDSIGNDYSTFDRIYAYDIDSNQPTRDYFFDITDNTTQPFNSKFISLGQRIKDDKNVAKYKIRLTEHLNNILLTDSTNTKIGLVLSTNVNYTNNSQILQSDDDVTAVPAASLLTPRGTILYGTNTSNEGRKMRLEIFFTEPNN